MAFDPKKFVFIVGLHRSGTSILCRCLKEHPEISGFGNTGVPEDEGQHLQTVFPTAKMLGGPGMFAFHPDAPMNENHALATAETGQQLLHEWGHHWNPARSVMLEKSPPTLIRTRFFQKLFPNSRFICVIRHPVAVSYATQKWSQTTTQDLLDHWHKAHRIFADDMASLNQAMTLKYEDFVADPQKSLAKIYKFIGLEPKATTLDIRSNINDKYFDMWQKQFAKESHSFASLVDHREDEFRSYGYSLKELAWLGNSILEP